MAIGDLHGDLQKTVAALKLAGVLSVSPDGAPVWCGGDTVIVQLGDILDRGDHEIQILHLFLRLKEQAKLRGGDVFLLNGNHESLNICGDFRYVTSGGFLESARVAGLPPEMGLYSSLLPLIAYAIFGSSPHLAVGPVSVVCVLIAVQMSEMNVPEEEQPVVAIMLALFAGLVLCPAHAHAARRGASRPLPTSTRTRTPCAR